MTLTPDEDLQTMIFNRLSAVTAVTDIVGGDIVDGKPSTYPCVVIGESDNRPDDYVEITGLQTSLMIHCWSDDQSRLNPCRRLTGAVKSALHEFAGSMAVHALARLTVVGSRVFLDEDGIRAHGVLNLLAEIEER